ncbi:hypothetical protein [Roseateles sp. BYS87W]|uniref:PAS domain-containing protein n=1 Tax=Pelomonas baiyunensis TaxID=3299026 RepID=A0ABW7GZW1_9BURK
MTDDKLWWETLQGGPVLLALFDVHDQVQSANAAYREAWGMAPGALPSWSDLWAAAQAQGLGPVGPPERRARSGPRAFEQAWRDGRRYWWVEQRLPNGHLAVTGMDITGQARPRPAGGQVLDAQVGLELLQSLLADSSAWPLSVATLPATTDTEALLGRIRGEDRCARLADGRLLLILPSTGPAQAVALGERLGAVSLVEAAWGDSASTLLARA